MHRMTMHRMTVMATLALSGIGPATRAAYMPVFGSPVLGPLYQYFNVPTSGAGNGVAAGWNSDETTYRFIPAQPYRWDSTGKVTTLNYLSPTYAGQQAAYLYAMNAAGTAVGLSGKIVDGVGYGNRAVRWDAGSSTAIELDVLSTDLSGSTFTKAIAINAAGECVGSARNSSGIDVGVRWDAAGRITVLRTVGLSYSTAVDINDNGVVCGSSGYFPPGPVPVRWLADGTRQQLGELSDSRPGGTTTIAINNAGTVIGKTMKTTTAAEVAIRWDAGTTTPVELRPLPGYFNASVTAINDSGVIIGGSSKNDNVNYTGGGVRWEPGATEPTPVLTPGRAAGYEDFGSVYAINNGGWIAGVAAKYLSSLATPVELHAAVWDASGSMIDLNTLIDPASGWTLNRATSISDTNWVSGLGTYKSGGLTYSRGFLIQVPEPALSTLAASGFVLIRRRRRV